MQKVAIVVDSVSCLPRDLVAKYDITIMPLSFYFDGKNYRDWVDITPTEAYELFLEDPESFKSSAVSPGHILEVFRNLGKEVEYICCITVSSKVSAVYSAALDAREIVKRELPHTSIEILDAQTVAVAEGLIALAAARATKPSHIDKP